MHQIKFVIHCALTIAADTMFVSLYRLFCTGYNVCITVPNLLQPIKYVYHCADFIAPDTTCESLYGL